MRKKHTFEERLLCVQRYLNGESATSISKDIGIDDHYIVLFAARYKQSGELGLKRQPNVRSTYELKLQVVQDFEKKTLYLSDIVVKYGVSRSSISI